MISARINIVVSVFETLRHARKTKGVITELAALSEATFRVANQANQNGSF